MRLGGRRRVAVSRGAVEPSAAIVLASGNSTSPNSTGWIPCCCLARCCRCNHEASSITNVCQCTTTNLDYHSNAGNNNQTANPNCSALIACPSASARCSSPLACPHLHIAAAACGSGPRRHPRCCYGRAALWRSYSAIAAGRWVAKLCACLAALGQAEPELWRSLAPMVASSAGGQTEVA